MSLTLKDTGVTTIQISRKTWVHVIILLVIAACGHVKLQWQMCSRLEANEKSICEFKRDYRETTKDLRDDIRELTTSLLDRKAKTISPAVATAGKHE